MICDKCGNSTISYYRQIRKDGVTVVTARCENDHIPETGHPFYSIAQFDVMSLPLLGGKREEKQQSLFSKTADEFEGEDLIERKIRLNRMPR